MIPSGEGKFCNMPTEVVQKGYADSFKPLTGNDNASVSGIDRQINKDTAKLHSQLTGK